MNMCRNPLLSPVLPEAKIKVWTKSTILDVLGKTERGERKIQERTTNNNVLYCIRVVEPCIVSKLLKELTVFCRLFDTAKVQPVSQNLTESRYISAMDVGKVLLNGGYLQSFYGKDN